MIPVTTARGRKVAVFGLGGSGLATAEALRAGGAEVFAYDDSAASREQAAAAGLAVVDLHEIDWDEIDMLVMSPGVPLTHPEPHWSVKLASAKAVPVIGDIELLAEEIRATAPTTPLIAITGTNGKSTTTALIAHLLEAAGRDVQLGGNIGRAVLTLDPPAPDRTYVVECSSFQIDLAPTLDPTVGVLLNLSPDHLDRHGTMQAYAAIKERLVAASRTAIVGVDDDFSRAIADRLEARGGKIVRISVKEMLPQGYFYAAGRIWSGGEMVADLGGIGSLRGAHNGQNAAAAIAAVTALGLDRDTIVAGLKTFPGLAHRMEEVGRLGRVLYINDSKATNADSTAQALATFTDIHWILGGKPKVGGISSLAGFFPRIAKAYLIGQATEDFAASLEGAVPYERCGTIGVALERASAEAQTSEAGEPVVLLSPACASYDQFKNFEVRGDRFRELVAAIPGIRQRGG